MQPQPPTNAERAQAAIPFLTKALDPAFETGDIRREVALLSLDELLAHTANMKALGELANRLVEVLLIAGLERARSNPGAYIEALRSLSREGR
jgi:hypothetical protein